MREKPWRCCGGEGWGRKHGYTILNLRGLRVFDLREVKIAFFDRGECQLPYAFYHIKKYVS